MLIDNELYKLKSNKIHVMLCSLMGLKIYDRYFKCHSKVLHNFNYH